MLVQNELPNDPHKEVRWSVLGVQYDKLHLAEKALKVQFIHSYRELTRRVDDQIKQIIEEQFAIGNEVYCDETGIYFVVSGHLIDRTSERDMLYNMHPNLNKVKENILQVFSHEFKGEIFPSIRLSAPSRTTLNISELIRQAKQNFTRPEFPKGLTSSIQDGTDQTSVESIRLLTGLCRVCKLRLATVRDTDMPLCSVCDNRKKDRLGHWLGQLLNSPGHETIWTAELQGRHGHLALVTLKFELEEWLNGNLLNSTYMMLPDKTWNEAENLFVKELSISNERKKVEETKICHFFDKALKTRSLFDVVNSMLIERTVGEEWERLLSRKFSNFIDYQQGKIEWSRFKDLSEDDQRLFVRIFMQLLFRRDPSPARLRRIWETTEGFFRQLKESVCDLLEIPRWRMQRLCWKIAAADYSPETYDGQYTYSGKLDFWVHDGTVYLTTSIEQAVKILSTQPSDAAFNQVGEQRTEWLRDEIRIKQVGGNRELVLEKHHAGYTHPYTPYFSILDPTPVSWQFIVPAEYVTRMVERVRERYMNAFRYVYGKLPLHIGIVTQRYKRPLYSGIQALRRIRRDLDAWDHVKTQVKIDDLFKISHPIEEHGKSPANYFSRYERIETGQEAWDGLYTVSPTGRTSKLAGPEVADQNVRVWVYPCTFDFEFLDVNTRRNEIRYVNARRDIDQKRCRPYNWEDWPLFAQFREKFLDQDQYRRSIHSLIELIYRIRQDWHQDQSSAQRFLLTAIVNLLELTDKDPDRQREKQDQFARLLGVDRWEVLCSMKPEHFQQTMDRLTDMFVFWHQVVKIDGSR